MDTTKSKQGNLTHAYALARLTKERDKLREKTNAIISQIEEVEAQITETLAAMGINNSSVVVEEKSNQEDSSHVAIAHGGVKHATRVRVIELLRSQAPKGVTISEIANKLEIYYNTAYVIITRLKREGFVFKNAITKEWHWKT